MLLFALALTLHPLTPKPRPALLDFEGQVKILGSILKDQSPRYRLLVADLFEHKQPYYTRAASSMLDRRQYIYRHPEDQAFALEMELIRRYQPAAANLRAFSIQTAFETPGQQHYHLLLREPIQLKGQLVRASLWIKSDQYAHRLDLLFKNASGRRVRVTGPVLNWRGWRRIEIDLPASLYHRGRRIDHRYQHSFTGFVIQSSRRTPAGAMSIMLDNFLILSDFQELNYPGTEMDDVWK